MPSEPTANHRVAIVTGGSRGIGRAIVEQLAGAGVEVRFTFTKNEEAAATVVAALAAEGRRARAERVDARDASACRAFVDRTIAELKRLDVLVNNAGVTMDRMLPFMSEGEWSGVLDTSLHGLFGTSKPAAAQMMRQRSGRIVNVTSVSGLIGMPGQTNYCAAKAAIIGFTRALAKELAAFGVSVNSLAPGYVETDMIAQFTEEQRNAALNRVPMRRFARPGEIADVVRYLALDAPAYLTGQTLVLDGGMTA